MKITHCGPFKIGTTNGSYNALWSLACTQAKDGHNVAIIRVGKPVTAEQKAIAAKNNIRLLGFPCPRWKHFWKDPSEKFVTLVNELSPDIVHLQYVRVPKYYFISKVLQQQNIPYVISLHGGLNSTEMCRKYIRKIIYWYLIERKVHKEASGIHFITSNEKDDYFNNLKMKPKINSIIYNAVIPPLDIPQWQPRNKTKIKFTYFGRFDVWHKGIDLTLEMLRVLQNSYGVETELHLYGSPGDRHVNSMKKINKKYKDVPMFDHGFVDGFQKYNQIVKYDFYIQYSRFELFGMSIVEAMQCGIPVIMSEFCDLTKEPMLSDAAILIPMAPKKAAKIIYKLLNQPNVINHIAKQGRKYSHTIFSSKNIAPKMLSFYKEAIMSKK